MGSFDFRPGTAASPWRASIQWHCRERRFCFEGAMSRCLTSKLPSSNALRSAMTGGLQSEGLSSASPLGLDRHRPIPDPIVGARSLSMIATQRSPPGRDGSLCFPAAEPGHSGCYAISVPEPWKITFAWPLLPNDRHARWYRPAVDSDAHECRGDARSPGEALGLPNLRFRVSGSR